ncbi:NYN domain-containing protein [Leminorella grimontii]|uniref:NYN domain-containing protein n=1 Tax=Leminorella grimontii TaxID=82981 RepID=UPI00321F86A3
MKSRNNVAVLIDAENISSSVMPDVMALMEKLQCSHIIRAYADWTKCNLNKWQEAVVNYGINPVHQPSFVSGKNSSDITLTIDAMDLMYSGQFKTFVLVTSDSDFVRLIIRLKESGSDVIGIGDSRSSPAFRFACSQFFMKERPKIKEIIALTVEENCILNIWPNAASDWLSVSELSQHWVAAGYSSKKGKFLKMLQQYPLSFLLEKNGTCWRVKRQCGEIRTGANGDRK